MVAAAPWDNQSFLGRSGVGRLQEEDVVEGTCRFLQAQDHINDNFSKKESWSHVRYTAPGVIFIIMTPNFFCLLKIKVDYSNIS